MSQYPPPYQPPQSGYMTPPGYPYPTGPDARGPARRAGIMLFILGGLAVLGGLCCGGIGAMVPQMLAQQPELAQQMPPGASPELIRIGMLVFAGISVVYGVAQVVLGLFVQKNSKGAMITAMVLAILSLLYLMFSAGRTMIVEVQQGGGGGPSAFGGVCVVAIPLVLYALLLAWLIQALRNVQAARAAGQYPAEYWAQLQQHYAQQAYQQQLWQQQQQQGGQTPPPPSPPPPPPPTSAD